MRRGYSKRQRKPEVRIFIPALEGTEIIINFNIICTKPDEITRCNPPGEIILYDGHLAVYKHSLDLIFYMIGGPSENELMLHSALVAFSEATHMLLRNQVEKRAVLENLDLIVLCLDETIDDGCVSFPWGCSSTFPLCLFSLLAADSRVIPRGVQDYRGD